MIIPDKFHRQWLAYGSSPVDWCEENYSVSPNIAEFSNTWSNVLMLVFPSILIYHGSWQSYIKHVSLSPKLILPWSVCVGLGSFYFHGTLSLLGQFTDEILLIWILLLVFLFALPSHYVPSNMTRKNFQLCIFIYGICLTCSWFINTAVFAFWIIPMGFPIIGVVFVEAYRCKYQPLRLVALLANVVNVAVALCWFIDRFACQQVKSIGLPGLHNVFHLGIAWSSYASYVVFAFCFAQDEKRHLDLRIKYVTILPYVYCSRKDCNGNGSISDTVCVKKSENIRNRLTSNI